MMSANGTLQSFPQGSNQFPFSVMPRIDGITPAGAGKFQVKGFLFQHADITDLKVFVGSDQVPAAPLVPGGAFYNLVDPVTIDLDTAGLAPGIRPLRLLINGIESEPNWITV
jgi:hypothetical protein